MSRGAHNLKRLERSGNKKITNSARVCWYSILRAWSKFGRKHDDTMFLEILIFQCDRLPTTCLLATSVPQMHILPSNFQTQQLDLKKMVLLYIHCQRMTDSYRHFPFHWWLLGTFDSTSLCDTRFSFFSWTCTAQLLLVNLHFLHSTSRGQCCFVSHSTQRFNPVLWVSSTCNCVAK